MSPWPRAIRRLGRDVYQAIFGACTALLFTHHRALAVQIFVPACIAVFLWKMIDREDG